MRERSRLKKALADSTPAVADRESLASDFDFGSFEVAEDAGNLIAELWSDSCTDQLSRFHRALDSISKQHEAPSAAAAIETLPQEKLRELACRPGSVAWQRTIINSGTGKNVFAVDGTVTLTPPNTYLVNGFITGRTAQAESLVREIALGARPDASGRTEFSFEGSY